jgi:hypothetical protein
LTIIAGNNGGLSLTNLDFRLYFLFKFDKTSLIWTFILSYTFDLNAKMLYSPTFIFLFKSKVIPSFGLISDTATYLEFPKYLGLLQRGSLTS